MRSIFLLVLMGLCIALSARADVFTVEGKCEAKFSPRGGAQDMLVRYIGQAKHSISVMAYSFTSAPIADALISAHQRGVKVMVILDKSQLTAKNSQLSPLVNAGVQVWVDSKHAIAHNKVMIIDGTHYENGSFNYTASAENSNGENAVVCKSVAGATVFTSDFGRHMAHSEAQ